MEGTIDIEGQVTWNRGRATRLRPQAGGFFFLLAGCLAAIAGILPAEAQTRTFQTYGDGILAGRFILYPSLSLDFMRDSNVRYSSDDLSGQGDLGSGVMVLNPRLMVDLPIGRGRVRWVYSPVYRNYTEAQFRLPRQFSHAFDLEATLAVGSALHVSLRDHYMRGVMELQEIDGGGELTFGLTPFTSHTPSMQIDLDLGARHGISVLPRRTRVRFEDLEDAALLSYDTNDLEGRYNFRLSPSDTLYAFYTLEETDQRRGSTLFPDLTFRGRDIGLGMIRTINEEVTTSVAAGYKRLTFEGGPAENFTGLAANIDASIQLSESTSLGLILQRQPYQSFFLDNSYYMDDQVGLRFIQQLGSSLYWEVSGTVRNNDYAGRVNLSARPDTPATVDCDHDGDLDGSDCNANGLIDSLESSYCLTDGSGSLVCPSMGDRRRDRASRFEIGVGFRPLRTMRFFIGYNTDRRRSNIEAVSEGAFFDPYDYNVSRFFFRIQAGWL